MAASQLVTRSTRHYNLGCDELTVWRVDWQPRVCDDLIDCYDELTVTNYIGYVVLSFVLSKLLVNLGHGDLFSNY